MPIKNSHLKATNEKGVFGLLKFGESYTSLILGIVIVVVATVFVLSFVKNKNITARVSNDSQTAVNTQDEAGLEEAKKILNNEQKSISSSSTYTVAEGDSPWEIAEKKYKSGYNWVDIAKANNLSNPGVLYTGMKLTLPKVEPKLITTNISNTNDDQVVVEQAGNRQEPVTNINKITGSYYTISKGDNLWDVAVRAYGDGYQWAKIAKANNLTDPGLIHVGNSLSIPR